MASITAPWRWKKAMTWFGFGSATTANTTNSSEAEAEIKLQQITATVRRVMDSHKVVEHPTLEKILEADAWARIEAAKI